jgi:hypothetical protein
MATALAALGCGGAVSAGAGPLGVYANAEGTASVEFMADGRAHFSLHGLGGICTYTRMDRAVTLTCGGDTTEFIVEDDGSLTGPAESFLTRLTRRRE